MRTPIGSLDEPSWEARQRRN